MTLELISARKKIKQYIKQMPEGSDREYLDKVQRDLKSFVNNTREKNVVVHKVYGNKNISIWSVEQNFIAKNVTLVLDYNEDTRMYQLGWAFEHTEATSFRHSAKLEYSELKKLIVEVFNEEFVKYAKH